LSLGSSLVLDLVIGLEFMSRFLNLGC